MYSPYPSEAANTIYNLLFCDDASAFLARSGEEPAPWQAELAQDPPDLRALRILAADERQEGRVRYLAYQALRHLGESVPPRQLLGVIIEVPLAGGLDALAAYSNGGVRYVNQSGRIAVVDAVPSMTHLVQDLFAMSQPVVDAIGPWKEARLAPPKRDNIRLTFLVSDGLYFGEAPMTVMQREPMAAPIIQRATELLQAVVAIGAS
ncbi:hypothetical protein KBZ18_09160 [Synechococcus sp. Cruz-9H2]|uniref:hypothetical protein n=1 Tax=unclassified Synechococcus TaxID=2626047 RepID=UPI0020CF357E|nr:MULTISPECIES: hypothetical protein [unclassified Synechococcus]MCP9819660.1 hypothetical protein [Synechococcus sp. Cruz-9H2]MCP9843965.1 hypothetical protein [Synechococcus sp. Edmonson 11F2]MCP9856090.1 hypothetical protein [Synechococcus sp. Cruz-9C9]MCP9863374.1 hypothetical protein [Synechococcus sp. Cruz-7E5]MCP9870599.1 hypothetical protein [Synechococcus sp. Cruz-7B9]